MTEQDVYERLREHLDGLPIGYPSTKSGVELRLLRQLFTEEEAEMAINLSPFAATAGDVAEKIGQASEKVEALLEQMSTKGLIFNARKGGITTYRANWFLIGIFDFQGNRMTKKFATDFDQYMEEGLRDELYLANTRQLRVVPVNKAVDAVDKSIVPYDDARELIKQQSKIVVANCICREKAGILEESCDKPLETCLNFSTGAYYRLEHGTGREVTQEEALEIIDRSERLGLVMSSGNAQKTFALCSCCGDCCEFLANLKKYPKPSSMVASNYYSEVDPELCTSCQECLDRCKMDAIAIDDVATIDLDRCIGCGLCVTTCPEDALSLQRKAEDELTVPPANPNELYMKIGIERMQRQSS